MTAEDKKPSILVVDDTPDNIAVLDGILRADYKIKVALNGPRALSLAQSDNPPDIILLDIMMPEMDGYEVCRRLKKDPRTHDIPVLFVTALRDASNETEGLRLGAVDYIIKPIIPDIVRVRVKNHLELKKHRDHLEEMVRERTEELAITQDVTILSLASLAETRDNETGAHIRRTQSFVRLLARQLCRHPRFSRFLTDINIELLYKSAPLHDIGKVGVPDRILLKPGKLTDEEFDIMKKHSLYGHEAIVRAQESLGSQHEVSFLSIAREITISHHERWDGRGYPYGLSEEDIPISGRLMALADVYDALISKRVYKPPFSHQKSVDIIMEEQARQFDPDITDAFKAMEDDFRKTVLEFSDYDEEENTLTTGE